MTPEEVTLHQRSGILELRYEDDAHFELTAEYLRVFSPSAEVRGHSPEQAVLQHGKKNVKISALQPQGNYAVRITFTDGHDSGIYSWKYLYELGRDHDANWADYLRRLEAEGKSREPQFIAVGR